MRHKNKFGGDVSNRGHYSTNSNKALFSGNPPQNDQQHLHCLFDSPQNGWHLVPDNEHLRHEQSLFSHWLVRIPLVVYINGL